MRLLLGLLTLAVITTCLAYGAPQQGAQDDLISIEENSVYKAKSDDLLSYEPKPHRESNHVTIQEGGRANSDKRALNLERESTKRSRLASPTRSASTADEIPESPNTDKFSSIAHNSREVRLVGPNKREVEMKDDMATKMVVVLENLSKEATDVWGQVNEKLDQGWKDIKRSEVWGQVNEKLDKGWTDLKSMVEGVVAPAKRTIEP